MRLKFNVLQRLVLGKDTREKIAKSIAYRDVWGHDLGPASADLDIEDSPAGWIQAYRMHPDVRRCVDLRASLIASVPLRLYRLENNGRDRKPVEDHRVLTLLEEVNPYDDVTSRGIWYRTEQSLCIFGDCWWYMDRRSEGGRPKSIFLLRSQAIDHSKTKIDPGKWLRSIVYDPNPGKDDARTIRYPALVLFRYPDPAHEVRGLSPISSLTGDVEASLHARAWNSKFFKNGARPSIALIVPDTLTESEREGVRESFEKAYAQGDETAHKTIVLEGGVKVVDLQVRPKDADWEGLRQTSKEKIYDVYGVPIALSAGTLNEAAAKAKEEATDFWTQTLVPEMAYLAETLRWRLLRMGYTDLDPRKHVFEFDTSAVPAMRRANLDRASELETATGGPYLTPDETRSLIGLRPLADGKGKDLNQPYRYEYDYRGRGEPNKAERSDPAAEVRRRLERTRGNGR